MQGREHRPAVRLAPPAGGVHQFPGGLARGVLEGRAAGLLADRLGLLPPGGDLVHPCRDGGGVVRRALEQGAGEDQSALRRPGGLAIAEPHFGVGDRDALAGPGHRVGLHQDVLGLRAIATGVHHHRATDGARNPAIELQPGDSGLAGLPRHRGVQGRGAREDAVGAPRLDAAERASGQADHHAFHPAIPHQCVGTHPQNGGLHPPIEAPQEPRQVVLVLGQEQHVGRPSHPEPGEGRQGFVEQQLAAYGGKIAPPAHPCNASSWPGKA